MNTPSPLVPQGTLPDSRGKSHIRIAVFSILAVHAVLLGTLLIFGCKKAPDQLADQSTILEPTNNAFPAPPPQMAFTPQQFPESTAVQPVAVPPVPTTVAPEPPPSYTPPPVPSAIATPLPQATDSSREHMVARGESFYTIAKKYGTSMRAIAQANPGVDARRLKIGQKLVVPPPQAAPAELMADAGAPAADVHVVKSGENLTVIARRHGVSVRDLQSANQLRTTQIRVGQKLRIPEKAAAAPASDGIPPLTPTSTTVAPTIPPLPQ